jgi:predicted component of type VI protein secretion system
MKKIVSFFLLVVILMNTDVALADTNTDKKIAQLEKLVATLQVEVEGLKALEKQALFLRTCVSSEKSTNSLKVSMKLASCTVDYFKKSKEAEKKRLKK